MLPTTPYRMKIQKSRGSFLRLFVGKPITRSIAEFLEEFLPYPDQVIKIFESNLGNHNLTFGIDDR